MINGMVFLLTLTFFSEVAYAGQTKVNAKQVAMDNLVHATSYYTGNYDRIRAFLVEINAALKMIDSAESLPTQEHLERVRLVAIQLDYLNISLANLVAQRKRDSSLAISKRIVLWNRQKQENHRIKEVRKALGSYVRNGENARKKKFGQQNGRYFEAYNRMGESVAILKGMADWAIFETNPPQEELQILRARLDDLCDDAYQIGYQYEHDRAVQDKSVLQPVKQQLLNKIRELLARISVCLDSIKHHNKPIPIQHAQSSPSQGSQNERPANSEHKQNLQWDRTN